MTSGNLTEIFKEVSADALVTQRKKRVRTSSFYENLSLQRCSESVLILCIRGVSQHFCLCRHMYVMQVYYYFIIPAKRCDFDTAWANGREIPCSALPRQVCSDEEIACSVGLVFMTCESSRYY